MASTTAETVTTADAPRADPLARLKKQLAALEQSARATPAAKRAEALLEKLPGRLERELDAALDRVGLVRKARVNAVVEAPAAAPAEQA